MPFLYTVFLYEYKSLQYMSTILNIISPKYRRTIKENNKLKKDNELLHAKLDEKQAHINETNRYWKGQMKRKKRSN